MFPLIGSHFLNRFNLWIESIGYGEIGVMGNGFLTKETQSSDGNKSCLYGKKYQYFYRFKKKEMAYDSLNLFYSLGKLLVA